MQVFTNRIINAHTNAGSGSVASDPIDARFVAYLTAQASFTDAASAGTLKIPRKHCRDNTSFG